MNALRALLIPACLVLFAAALPAPVAASPCTTGCAEIDLQPCVGVFAEGFSSQSTTWTLTYEHNGGTVTETTTGFSPPPAAASPECWIPGCYSGTLTNTLGLYLHEAICIQ